MYEAPTELRIIRSRAAQLKSDLANNNPSAAAAFIAGWDISDDPETIKEAVTSKNAKKWQLATRQEYMSFLRNMST